MITKEMIYGLDLAQLQKWWERMVSLIPLTQTSIFSFFFLGGGEYLCSRSIYIVAGYLYRIFKLDSTGNFFFPEKKDSFSQVILLPA